jgi:hypothetical protein
MPAYFPLHNVATPQAFQGGRDMGDYSSTPPRDAAPLAGHVDYGKWEADISVPLEVTDRMAAFILAAERIETSTFAGEIDQIKFRMQTKYTRIGENIHWDTTFGHPPINIESFESFALRFRPVIFERDICNFEKVLVDARVAFAESPLALADLSQIEALYSAQALREQLSEMTSLCKAASPLPRPVMNFWNVIFGGNVWMRPEFHDELFLFGFLYHWNASNDKWKHYLYIEQLAGGQNAIIRCMIPFFQSKLLAVSFLKDILLHSLLALGVVQAAAPGAERSASIRFATSSLVDVDFTPDVANTSGTRPVHVASAINDQSETGDDENASGFAASPVIDIQTMADTLAEGKHLIEEYSWRLRDGKMKYELSLSGSDRAIFDRIQQSLSRTPK